MRSPPLRPDGPTKRTSTPNRERCDWLAPASSPGRTRTLKTEQQPVGDGSKSPEYPELWMTTASLGLDHLPTVVGK